MVSSDQLFCSIYKRYFAYLLKRAKDFGIAAGDSEDLVLETFAAYYKTYPLTWEDYQIFSALIQILRNCSIDYHRKCSRHPQDLFNPQEVNGFVNVQRRKYGEVRTIISLNI